jgi:hypothetical protein
VTASPSTRTELGLALGQRLADIDRRLAELRQARVTRPAQVTVTGQLRQARHHVQDADRHRRESMAHTQAVRQLLIQAFHNAALAHDHAAEANERSAGAGIGDIAEHRRRAEFHRAAAEADRQRARLAAADGAVVPRG